MSRSDFKMMIQTLAQGKEISEENEEMMFSLCSSIIDQCSVKREMSTQTTPELRTSSKEDIEKEEDERVIEASLQTFFLEQEKVKARKPKSLSGYNLFGKLNKENIKQISNRNESNYITELANQWNGLPSEVKEMWNELSEMKKGGVPEEDLHMKESECMANTEQFWRGPIPNSERTSGHWWSNL